MAKWIMSALTAPATVAAVIAAIKHPRQGATSLKTPWQLTALPFIVSLLGWMPAVGEISAINSLWSRKKTLLTLTLTMPSLTFAGVVSSEQLFLRLFFVALGTLIQYPTGKQ